MNTSEPTERAKLIAHVASRLIAAAHADLDATGSKEALHHSEDHMIERAIRIVERVEQRCGVIST